MKFGKHELESREFWCDGENYKVFFDNGYGASIVRFTTEYGSGSYGHKQGLYELGVMVGTAEEWSLHYDNPVAGGDVVGYLTPEEVGKHLETIEGFDTLSQTIIKEESE